MRKNDTFDYVNALKLLGGNEKTARVAFQNLYNHRAKHVYHVSRKLLRSDELARDVTQDVFLTIWEKRTQLSHIRNFEFYIYGMVRKSINMVIRSKVYEEMARKQLAVEGPEIANPYKEKYALQLDEIVEQFPPRVKRVFFMAKIQGLKYEEIAEQLNITIHTVCHDLRKSLKIINARKQDITTFLFLTSALLESVIIQRSLDLFRY